MGLFVIATIVATCAALIQLALPIAKDAAQLERSLSEMEAAAPPSLFAGDPGTGAIVAIAWDCRFDALQGECR
jgi:hypothetical protein